MKLTATGQKKQDSTKKELVPTESWAVKAERAAFINHPGSEGFEARIIEKLYNYFDNKDKLTLDQFCRDHHIFRDTLHDWQETYPEIKKAVDRVKIWIADNRRQGTFNNKLNVITFKDLFLYDPETKEVDKYHADLKKQEEQTARDYTIHVNQATKPIKEESV